MIKEDLTEEELRDVNTYLDDLKEKYYLTSTCLDEALEKALERSKTCSQVMGFICDSLEEDD